MQYKYRWLLATSITGIIYLNYPSQNNSLSHISYPIPSYTISLSGQFIPSPALQTEITQALNDIAAKECVESARKGNPDFECFRILSRP